MRTPAGSWGQARTGCAPWPHLLASSLGLQRGQEVFLLIGDGSSPRCQGPGLDGGCSLCPLAWQACWWAQDLGYLELVLRWPQGWPTSSAEPALSSPKCPHCGLLEFHPWFWRCPLWGWTGSGSLKVPMDLYPGHTPCDAPGELQGCMKVEYLGAAWPQVWGLMPEPASLLFSL